MTSRIEQIIEEIEEYIDGCNYSPLSKKNIVVNKEEIEELLRELRMKTPDEIKRYQKILANKDAILADAQAKADAIVNQANIQLNELISEQEIMKQAYAQANAVVEAATAQAQEQMPMKSVWALCSIPTACLRICRALFRIQWKATIQDMPLFLIP